VPIFWHHALKLRRTGGESCSERLMAEEKID
jgi:hypothetical protein